MFAGLGAEYLSPTFAGLGEGYVISLTSILAAVILQNVVPGAYPAQALVATGGIQSILGLYLGTNLPVVASINPMNTSEV